MIRIGLDIGTGFVKCVSDYGSHRFPSLYAERINGPWTSAVTRGVGDKAARMLRTIGTTAISPVRRGRPQKQYLKQVGLLVTESLDRVYSSIQEPHLDKARVIVGLPYEASGHKDALVKVIRQDKRVESCAVVAQAAGTLVHMDKNSGMAISIGQGTSEIVILEDNKMLDGRSVEWASEFITGKIGKFAHLDTELLTRNKALCSRYAKSLVGNLGAEVDEMAELHEYTDKIVVSGGGILIPGVLPELRARLQGYLLVVPDDPVMSNAAGLHKLAQ